MRLPAIVALEGIDASGKATQAKMLADYLDARPCACGAPAHYVEHVDAGNPSSKLRCESCGMVGPGPCLRRSFPAYETDLGGLIRAALRGGWAADWAPGYPAPPAARMDSTGLRALVLQSLMVTNRHELADEIEYEHMVKSRSIVLDRYWASAVAYGAADGLDPKWLEGVHSRLPKAHHVLVDIPVEESFRRRPTREDAYEADRGRLERARAAYLALFERKGVDVGMLHGNSPGHVSPSGWAIVNGSGPPELVHRAILMVLGIGGAVP